MSYGKSTSLLDTWMEGTQSDESELENKKHHNPLLRNKQSRSSNASSMRPSNFMGQNATSSESSAELDDDDDADDEDWVASDSERKRASRGSTSARPPAPHRLPPNYRPTSYQRDRPRTKHHHISSRLSNQSPSNSVRHGRPGSQLQRTVQRNGYSRNQLQNSASTARRNLNKLESTSVSPKRCLPNELRGPRQCFGPGCTRSAARPDTKYCSEECGVKLAIRRLEVFLPDRLRSEGHLDDFKRSAAEQLYRARLEKIQCEKCSIHDRLLQLEMEHQQLTTLISRARESKPTLVEEAALDEAAREAEQVEQMEPVICVTCASEVSMRHALRHMEKCFQKMEGNTVFCASQKEQIVGTPLFCDTYDNQAKAYCKRLRVVCEHFKEPKLPADTICGFPLVRQVFIETGEFCSVPRSKCSRHLGWERLRRAHIDIERYRCLIRMDELLQEEQRLRQSIAQRGGILGLILHQTIDHNPSVSIRVPSETRKPAQDTITRDTNESPPFCSP